MTICLNSQGLAKQLEHSQTHTLICCWLPRHIIDNYIVRSGARDRRERNKGRILSLRVIKRKRDIYRGNNIVEYSHTHTHTL